MGLRDRKKARTRDAISGAAIALFLQRGYDAVSIAEIAAAADVSRRTLFAYFPTKDDLVLHRFADHEDEAARVLTVVARAIDQVCTVGRTLKSGTEVTFEVSDAGVS